MCLPVTVAEFSVNDDSVVAAVTVTKVLLETTFPLPSAIEAVIVKTEFGAALLGGVKTAVAPLLTTVPPSADLNIVNRIRPVVQHDQRCSDRLSPI